MAAAACYLGTAACGFAWDDIPLVRDNRFLAGPVDLPRLLGSDLWAGAPVDGDSGYFRPLVLLSFALDRWLWDLRPAPMHLHSLAWHLLAGWALWRLLAGRLPPGAAAVGMGVFLLHPVQSEAVCWIAARNDPMAAALLFCALGLLAPRRPVPARLAVGSLLFLLALLAKESAILAPLVLAAMDLAAHGRPVGRGRYLGLAAGLVAWAGLRAASGVGGPDPPRGEAVALVLGRLPDLLATWAALLVDARVLTIGRSIETLDAAPRTWLAAGGALVLVAGLALRAGRRALPGLVLAVAGLAPALVAVASRGQVGERYLYLPLAGVGWVAAAGWPAGRAMAAAGFAVAAAWCVRVVQRVPDWRGPAAIWEAAVRDTPSGFTWGGLGHERFRAGDLLGARRAFERALAADPPNGEVCRPYLLTFLRRGEVDEGPAAVARIRGRGCPADPALRGTAASLLAQAGAWEAAAREFPEALSDPSGRGLLVGVALAEAAGDADAVEAAARRACRAPAAIRAEAGRLVAVGGSPSPGRWRAEWGAVLHGLEPLCSVDRKEGLD